MRTAIIPPGGRLGRPTYGGKLYDKDICDGNEYTKPTRLGLSAAGEYDGTTNKCDRLEYFESLAEWRTATKAAGNEFDVNSREIDAPTGVNVRVLKNHFELNRADVIVDVWSPADAVQIPLDGVVATNTEIVVTPLNWYIFYVFLQKF